MTPLEKVYEAFLAKMLDDEWANWDEDNVESDLRQLLNGALPYFKFPRISLQIDGESFEGDLSNEEIQILATYMKVQWFNREILTWERIKPLYEERDFSEANMLNKLYEALAAETKNAQNLEAIYYRSIKSRPWDYTKLAGDQS